MKNVCYRKPFDSLIDNSQRGKALSRRGRRELKSLSDMLKGKKGRFRRNLLGKRVGLFRPFRDCGWPEAQTIPMRGLPKTMALELYRPFVIAGLVKKNYAANVKGARRLMEAQPPRSLGGFGRSHRRSPGFAEPCAYAAPFGYPSL